MSHVHCLWMRTDKSLTGLLRLMSIQTINLQKKINSHKWLFIQMFFFKFMEYHVISSLIFLNASTLSKLIYRFWPIFPAIKWTLAIGTTVNNVLFCASSHSRVTFNICIYNRTCFSTSTSIRRVPWLWTALLNVI